MLIVFATNLKPESLADEAFLRRIPYKILAKNPTMDEYCRIFELNCQKRGICVRSGDGRVPESQVLPAAQAADARLPSARPDRAGRRPLPLSRTASRRSRASCSTRRAAATSSRRPTSQGNEQHEAAARRRRRRARRVAPAARSASSSGCDRRPQRDRAEPHGPSRDLADRLARDAHRRAVLVHGGAASAPTSSRPAGSPGCCCSRAKRSSSC